MCFVIVIDILINRENREAGVIRVGMADQLGKQMENTVLPRLLSQNGSMSRLGVKASHKLEDFFSKLLKLNFNLGTSLFLLSVDLPFQSLSLHLHQPPYVFILTPGCCPKFGSSKPVQRNLLISFSHSRQNSCCV